MPIRLLDGQAVRARVASTLGDSTAALSGTFSAAPGRSGSIATQLQNNTAALRGSAVTSAASTGTVSSTLTSHSALMFGNLGTPGAMTHGQEFNINGSGFGTRSDYNAGNYTWLGHRHIHRGWLDFAGGFPAGGSSKATFQSDAFCKGFFPAGGSVSGYNFNANIVSNDGVTIQTGGVSQSQRYFHKLSTGFAQGGYMQLDVTNLTPCDGIVIFKVRSNANAKIYREHREDGGGDWFHGSGGQFLDEPGGGWPYDSTAFGDGQLSATVWKRHEIVKSVSLGCQTRINATVADFGPYINGNQVSVTRIPLTTTLQNGKLMNCTWPNSVDTGQFFDVADIYYDQTAARVELWSDTAGTIREVQIVKSWTNSQIKIATNRGQLSLGPVKIKIISASDTVIATIDGVLQ